MPEIRIDTSELTYPWFWVPGHLAHFVDGSVPGGAVVHLEPGDYPFQQTRDRPCDVGFRVTDDGTVDFDAEHDHLLRGRGTSTLHVVGVPVTLHPTGASCPLLPMWGGCHEPIGTRARTVRMPPGTAYEIRLGLVPSAVLEFSVAADGRVDYPSQFERALSGRGTARLTVDLDTLGRH
jgi:hypothetical protein